VLRSRPFLTAAVAVVMFFATAYALSALPVLPDTDSYYHMAVARLFTEEGVVDRLPWPRFSAMHEGFGDKEILFHALLMPFTLGDPTIGGRVAIALSNAFMAGAIAWLAIGAIGPWGALVAPLLYLAAPYIWIRSIRLRPEFFSLVIFLLIAHFTVRRRIWTLAALGVVFTLSHTAFHVVAAMAVGWLLVTLLFERTFDWKPAVATLGGIAAGVLVHPQFPDNLKIWYLQNVGFLQFKNVLDTGAETRPPLLRLYAMHNIGWVLAVVAAIVLLRPWRNKPSRATLIFGSMTAVFLVLQLMMERISTYFLPMMTLTLVYACAGLVQSRRAMVLTGLVAIAAAAASTPFAIGVARSIVAGVPQDLERDYALLSSKIPAGAKIAARWGATDAFVFWAPQGRYLNVLDPVFFAIPHPGEYWAQRRMFDAVEPDMPFVTAQVLDSDYIAFSRFETSKQFMARIAKDPRFDRLHDGYNVLLRVNRNANGAFVLDWQNYPLRARDVEGFIDADRIAPGAPCATLTHVLRLAAPTSLSYELAPWGKTRIWIDDQLRAAVTQPLHAILGRGGVIDANLAAGEHEIRVETCRDGDRSGFYLRRVDGEK